MAKLTVRYDNLVDSMTIDAAPDIRIATSSSVDHCLIADYGSEDGYDVIGIELLAVGKLLAPFCASNKIDALKAQKVAATMAPLQADYDKEADTLTIQSGRDVEFKSDVGEGLIAYLGYEDYVYHDRYDVVGIELHNASQCLAPWFRLNRAPNANGGVAAPEV
jgi:uncharacterized protein YuzE